MRISIPKDIAGGLKVLPEGPCRAAIEGVSVGKSKEGNPKATVRYVLLTELYKPEDQQTSIGERVLETFSLLPQALWNIGSFYKEATGENVPQGDYEDAELQETLEEGLKGTEWDLILETDLSPDGNEMTKVAERHLAK